MKTNEFTISYCGKEAITFTLGAYGLSLAAMQHADSFGMMPDFDGPAGFTAKELYRVVLYQRQKSVGAVTYDRGNR